MEAWFVCVMGICTVFAGLIALIFICSIVSAVCKIFGKSTPAPALKPPAQKNSGANYAIANKNEILAAACAAIAEELGEDVKNIKVVSFKKA